MWIYSLGWLVFGLCVAFALPRRAEGLQSLLGVQISRALAQAGLNGIDVRMDGQAATLSYRDDAAEVIEPTAQSARDRMLRAIDVASGVGGGLSPGGSYGGLLMGPVTRVQMDEGSVDGLQARLDSAATRNQMDEQVQKAAVDCTRRVSDAVASRRLAFISGSAELTGDSQTILRDIFDTVQSCPQGLVLSVEGHTDTVGQPQDNMTLSTRRAEAAALALIDLGLPQVMVTSRGFGPNDPIAGNDSEEGRARNRRVDFILRPRRDPEGGSAIAAAGEG